MWFDPTALRHFMKAIVVKHLNDYDNLSATDVANAEFVGYREGNHIFVSKWRRGPSGMWISVDTALRWADEEIIPWDIFTPDEIVKWKYIKESFTVKTI